MGHTLIGVDVDHARRHDGEKNGVHPHPRALPKRRAMGRFAGHALIHRAFAVKADQAARAINLVHDAVARIDAEPAPDAAQLQSLADVDAGRADMDAEIAIDAVAPRFEIGRLIRRPFGDGDKADGFIAAMEILQLAAQGDIGLAPRLAPPVLITDDKRVFVEQSRLKARPGAHIQANAFTGETGQQIGRGGEQEDEEIQRAARLPRHKIAQRGRRIIEIEDQDAAGEHRDHEPSDMLGQLLAKFAGRFRIGRQLDPRVAVALNPPFDLEEQIGPQRLRAGEATPQPPIEGGDEEQPNGRNHHEAGAHDQIFGPKLNAEEEELRLIESEENGLIRSAGTTVPAQERNDVI